MQPLGAPTDPLRPTGRVAEEAMAGSKARMEAKARRILTGFLVVLAVAAVLALLVAVVAALLPMPDL